MNYIVLDLEWNQSMGGAPAAQVRPGKQPPTCEIIEIGAVKMNESFELLDEFDALIHPVLYQKMHFATREVTGFRMEDLQDADGFETAIKEFLAWIVEDGEPYMFCTWGSMDLTELQRNMDYYDVENPFDRPLFYFDIQKLYSWQYEDGDSRRSLEAAVEALEIPKKLSFHRASADTYYTALVMSTLDMDVLKARFSVDYHRLPRTRREELDLKFPGYTKFVSRTYYEKDEAMEDPKLITTPCPECGQRMRKKLRWFSNGRNYSCIAVCPEHGLMEGKIRLRRTDEGLSYGVRTIKPVTQEELNALKQRKTELAAKRREKRNRQPVSPQ